MHKKLTFTIKITVFGLLCLSSFTYGMDIPGTLVSPAMRSRIENKRDKVSCRWCSHAVFSVNELAIHLRSHKAQIRDAMVREVGNIVPETLPDQYIQACAYGAYSVEIIRNSTK